jgi:hypothetical protein
VLPNIQTVKPIVIPPTVGVIDKDGAKVELSDDVKAALAPTPKPQTINKKSAKLNRSVTV